MRQLLLRASILLSLPVLAALLASCGSSAGAAPTATTETGTTVPALTAAAPTNTAAPPTDTALPPTQAPPAQTDTPNAPTAPPPAGVADYVLTNKDNNSSVTLKVGDTLLVELRDRQWSTPKVDSSILGIAPLNIAVPQGVQAWKYKALAPGQTDLTSRGQCPPNPGGITCTSVLIYKVTVTVMGAGLYQ
jgi:hypothetical protein